MTCKGNDHFALHKDPDEDRPLSFAPAIVSRSRSAIGFSRVLFRLTMNERAL